MFERLWRTLLLILLGVIGTAHSAPATPVTLGFVVDPSRSWGGHCEGIVNAVPCLALPLPEERPTNGTFLPLEGAFAITVDLAAGSVAFDDQGVVVPAFPPFIPAPDPLFSSVPGELGIPIEAMPATLVGGVFVFDWAPFVASDDRLRLDVVLRLVGDDAILEGLYQEIPDIGPIEFRVHGVPVPEPGAATLAGVALALLAGGRRRAAARAMPRTR